MTSPILFGMASSHRSANASASSPTRISPPAVPSLPPTHRSSSSQNNVTPPTPIFKHRRHLNDPTDGFIVQRDRPLDTGKNGFYLDQSRNLASIEALGSSGGPVPTPKYQFWRGQVAPNQDVDALTLTAGSDRERVSPRSGLRASHIRELRTHLPLVPITYPPFGKVPVYRQGEGNIPEDQHHFIWNGDPKQNAEFYRAKVSYGVLGKLFVYHPTETPSEASHHFIWNGDPQQNGEFQRAKVSYGVLGKLFAYHPAETPPEHEHYFRWDGDPQKHGEFVRGKLDHGVFGKLPIFHPEEKDIHEETHYIRWNGTDQQAPTFVRGVHTSQSIQGQKFPIYLPNETAPRTSHYIDHGVTGGRLHFIKIR